MKTVFQGSSDYTPDTTRVWLDGVKQQRGTDYTESDPQAGKITFGTAPGVGVQVALSYEVGHIPQARSRSLPFPL